MTALAGWQNFYVIVGSAAGALIGLQFVAISLINNLPKTRTDLAAGHAFATPTIVHFTAVLVLAGVLSAPWDNDFAPTVAWGVGGLMGVVYAILVIRRMRKQTAYRPEFEDWLFHAFLPLAAYVALAASALAAVRRPREALFGAAGAALLLLLIGIHNTWDAVTYHVFVKKQE